MQNAASLSIIIVGKVPSNLTPLKQIAVDLFWAVRKKLTGVAISNIFTGSDRLTDVSLRPHQLLCFQRLSFPGIHLSGKCQKISPNYNIP